MGHEAALHAYYIVLEAVANACKHGNAQNILISLEPKGERCLLSVLDDGLGFSLSNKAHTGMGVRIMQYRARVIGATLNLQSAPGAGAHLTCIFSPVAREELAGSGNGRPWKNSLD
jgi:signal transduction histidine kinase